MIVPKHRICNFCSTEVGLNKRYFVIKSKNILYGYAGIMRDNIKYDMCEDCMKEFTTYLHTKLKEEEDNKPTELFEDKHGWLHSSREDAIAANEGYNRYEEAPK